MNDPGWKVLKWGTIFVGGFFLLAYLLLPFYSTPREVSHKSSCKNNLKQIGLAMWEFHEDHGCFPPAYLVDADGRPMHSWRVMLLPYLGGQELYKQYRFDESWDSPHNSKLADQMPRIYRCPGYAHYCEKHEIHTPHLTNYVAITHPQGVFDRDRPITFCEITDGSSNTLTVAEVRQHAVHWMQPEDVTIPEVLADLKLAGHKKHNNHLMRMHLLFAGGWVIALESQSMNGELLQKLVTRDGGEEIDE